jgi:hypothetical protein
MRHHEFGPSRLGILFHCPGSHAQSKDLPDGVETEASREGTELHERIAGYIRANWGSPDAHEMVPDDEAVAKCWAFLLALADSQNDRVECEKEMDLGDGRFGTADVVVYQSDFSGDRTIVVDWKFGHKELDPAAVTLQIGQYAVAAQADLAFAYMPRFDKRYQLDITKEAAYGLQKQTRAIIKRAHDEPDMLVTGEHCQYCRALGTCPKTTNVARAHATSLDIAVDGKGVQKQVEAKVKAWPAEKVRQNLEYLSLLEHYTRFLKARAIEIERDQPGTFADWKVIMKKGQRAASKDDLHERLSAHLGPRDFWAAASITVASIERVFVEREGGDEKAAKKKFRELTDGIVRQKEHPELRRKKR